MNINLNNLYMQAKKIMPGGVNSPIRAFSSVQTTPSIIKKAYGPYLFDINKNCYIDYICTWGAIILGHNNIQIKSQIKKFINNGLHFGLLTEIEIKIAQLISKCMPSIEMIRMVNSGTEATMSAIRLARAYTQKNKIIKFDGCYHGHSDFLLTCSSKKNIKNEFSSQSISDGIPESALSETLSCPYNDYESVEKIFKLFSNQIACVIVEPIAGNMGCIPSQIKFLKQLRILCNRFNALLIMDEVITGFRISLGGAQSYYKIDADLTCLGKIIGGGLPIGAFGGKKEIMQNLTPTGSVYQAGTFSGNPISMIAGYTCLKILQFPEIYNELNKKTTYLINGLNEVAKNNNVSILINQCGSMFSIFFTKNKKIQSYQDVVLCSKKKFNFFFREMQHFGIMFSPSFSESNFVSLKHKKKDLDKTISAAKKVFKNNVFK
ncbi:glutamate-1-semialdehyde aminotransferase (aminomutase) [Wigglesworthia glossinidia endosymbiont of Glossina morsitans morsitans (Yale colony)]|uniref:Glutamate-1-semialdehyde 2,1-aminomutase n=1 Tax=Wigglesworthia glossinidia endosymbiont of Glossina morsitans morsitans (Yale colony) TaxID=1142511 RepID=H6Q5N3_WIGGL|nr:glutamate-1-semialdehyde 2,1-aminomutase [Wigglesworthia glossinidia]AFA40937.1 glutamate-1-semialdehyde aminotransferase (aminomutase) [Wigglesworthia glossinidia endosymbiont of Glossina morsitans morsitans (Yale colony)]